MRTEPVAVDAALRAFVLAVVALLSYLFGIGSELRALIDAVVITGVTLVSVLWTRQKVTPIDGPWLNEQLADAYNRGRVG